MIHTDTNRYIHIQANTYRYIQIHTCGGPANGGPASGTPAGWAPAGWAGRGSGDRSPVSAWPPCSPAKLSWLSESESVSPASLICSRLKSWAVPAARGPLPDHPVSIPSLTSAPHRDRPTSAARCWRRPVVDLNALLHMGHCRRRRVGRSSSCWLRVGGIPSIQTASSPNV